jgi:predicted nucleic acid-binding protein
LTAFFADTSALIKRYITEIGSAWVTGWIEPTAGNTIIISEITTVEVFSALTRRQHEGDLSTHAVNLLRSDFLMHVEKEYLVISLESDLLHQSRDLIAKHPLRTLDAIQLASALRAGAVLGIPLTFVSADRNLLAAAAAEGLTTEDPNIHP